LTKTFHIYRSSAGSGKTRTLAKAYIKIALTGELDAFRYAIAVTFANKATQEMKERILRYLSDFASGRKNNLTDELLAELKLTPDELQRRSSHVLSLILHRYSQFSISTIDAFFQRVIRSFTREAGLLGNFRLEVDNEFVLDEVIADLMDELGPNNPELTEWVTDFSRDRLLEGENWNITYALKQFAMEIFKDQFKEVEDAILSSKNPQADYKRVLTTLRGVIQKFTDHMQAKAEVAVRILAQNGITKEDFNYKDQGTAWKFFAEFAAGRYWGDFGSRVEGAALSASEWPSKKIPARFNKLRDLAERELMPILREMLEYNKEEYSLVRSAKEVLKNFYAFGLISDLTRKLRTYRDENNVMLLSDASKFLNGVINNSDTPFIYEKVGSYYRNYLIDEFQDTSGFQWRNFLPLLKEASDQNNSNLIVGDVKQSIYRWRGGDLELLQNEVAREFGVHRVDTLTLDSNYRSAQTIIEFNNKLFAAASREIGMMVNNSLPVDVFHDAVQKHVRWPAAGFVRFSILERADDEEDWMSTALTMLPGWFEQLQDKGVQLKDIAILVRKNDEGQRIANFMLQYRTSENAKKNYRYDVVSNESLRLDTSLSVNVLIAALRLLNNPGDLIARGQLAYELSILPGLDETFHKVRDGSLESLQQIFPKDFIEQMPMLKRLALFELTEVLIRIFGLGKQKEELAYITSFQDQVLEFSGREKADVTSFLEWWEMYKSDKSRSIKVSDSVDAANIMTIHASKGLEFKYVIVPFCSWRLNHEIPPLLWVKTDVDPFSKLGALAVRYNEPLEKTIFAAAYQEERTKVHLDNLNLLYVAFTRAEAGLIAFAPESRSGKVQTVGDLVQRAFLTDQSLAKSLTGREFAMGEVVALKDEREKESILAVKLDGYHSADWRNKLVIKREGAEFFEDKITDKRAKINRGILLHTIMSRIEYKTDAKQKLADFFLESALPPEEIEIITNQVHSILDHSQMGAWFTKDWKIKAEAMVLLPGGLQKRIDRIMLSDTRTVIVDYKTGSRKAIDKEQVEQYAVVLTQMGYPNVQAFLVYLSDLKVEEVIRKSNLSLF
jgi:ATP-dependent exoDNAse (exonuclease V) beta subunit